MTAQEIFKKIGFNLCVNDKFHLIYRTKHDKNGANNDPFNWDYIDFYRKEKTYSTDIVQLDINMELHKAIHQQLIELGWIE